MRAAIYFAAVLASAVSFVAAQDDSCEAENIVEACLPSIQIRIDGCDDQDWRCKCDTYTQLLTCYDNCPNDSRKFGVQSQVTSFCQAAAAQPSSSRPSVAPVSTPAPTTTSEDQAAETTDAALAAGPTGAATALNAPAGLAFAAILGFAGLL